MELGVPLFGLVLTLLVLVGFGTGFARRFARNRGRHTWPTIQAKVVDTSVVDGSQEEARTLIRVVLTFHPRGGELLAVDQTRRLVDWQKNQLLPEAEITIRYNPADPEDFEIMWTPREEERSRPASTSVYGPR